MRAHYVTPAARYVPVPIDLRQDWPAALRRVTTIRRVSQVADSRQSDPALARQPRKLALQLAQSCWAQELYGLCLMPRIGRHGDEGGCECGLSPIR